MAAILRGWRSHPKSFSILKLMRLPWALIRLQFRGEQQRLDNFDWKDSLAEMTPQQRQLIITLLPKLVTDVVVFTSRQALVGRRR
jgi:hypothetical protein